MENDNNSAETIGVQVVGTQRGTETTASVLGGGLLQVVQYHILQDHHCIIKSTHLVQN